MFSDETDSMPFEDIEMVIRMIGYYRANKEKVDREVEYYDTNKAEIDDGIAYYEANKVKIDKMIAYYERMRKIKVVASEMRGKGNQDKGQGNPPDLPGNQGNNDQEPPVEPEPPANQGRQGNNK